MDGVTHIGSLLTAPWSGWMMLVLLLCAVLAEWFQPGVITQAPSVLMARTQRTYKDAPASFLGQLLIALFRIGTVSMALCLCFCAPGHAPLAAFGAVCGWVLAVLLLKMLCNLLIDYTFSLSRLFGNMYEAYGDIATVGATVLYSVVLVLMHVPNTAVILWTVVIVAVLFIAALTYRAARMYVTTPLSVVHLIIYMATLEVLPMAMLFFFSAKTIVIL